MKGKSCIYLGGKGDLPKIERETLNKLNSTCITTRAPVLKLPTSALALWIIIDNL